jgi:hypothetical protein
MNKITILMNNKPFTLPVTKIVAVSFLLLIGMIFILASRELTNHVVISTILELTGSFILVAIPIEYIKEAFDDDVSRKKFATEMSSLFDSKIDTLLFGARKIGLSHIEGSVSVRRLLDDLQPNDTLWWLDIFSPSYLDWSLNVKNAIHRGASIKMFILDQETSNCRLRAKELKDKYPNDSFVQNLDLFTRHFVSYQNEFENKKTKGHLDVRIYNDLIGVPCYVVKRGDKAIYAYSSMYLKIPTSMDFSHFYWCEGTMCQNLFNYIEGKYDSSKSGKDYVRELDEKKRLTGCLKTIPDRTFGPETRNLYLFYKT